MSLEEKSKLNLDNCLAFTTLTSTNQKKTGMSNDEAKELFQKFNNAQEILIEHLKTNQPTTVHWRREKKRIEDTNFMWWRNALSCNMIDYYYYYYDVNSFNASWRGNLVNYH